MAYFTQSVFLDRHKNWAFFKAISLYVEVFDAISLEPCSGTQRNFGVVVVANSSCLHLDLDLCSSFRFDVVSFSLCRMHMYIHGKGRHACKCVGKCFDGISP